MGNWNKRIGTFAALIAQDYNMTNVALEYRVGQLSGYMLAASTFSGALRQFESTAYIINLESPKEAVDAALTRHFLNQIDLSFENVKFFEGAMRGLEKEIEGLILKDTAYFNTSVEMELKKYLSFRAMDMIDGILADFESSNVEVFRLDLEVDHLNTSCVFFCIKFGMNALTLQFNEYHDFEKLDAL